MGPVEGRGLDTDSGSSDSLDGHWSVFCLDPLGSRRPIGQKEEKHDAKNDSDRAKDVEDQFPSESQRGLRIL